MSAEASGGLDVIVPVYNGHDALVACLASLAAHTAAPHRVWLLDDASSDARIRPLLDAAAKASPHFEVVAGERNLGFVGNVNRGLALATRDVVVLNADSLVTGGWLERLARCRDSDPAIGIACPLSNRATLLSIPEVVEVGAGLAPDAIAQHIARASTRAYPRIPTAVGSCMLITREALARCGPLDEAYAPGYGEENDFSMRARQAGFAIACADDAYVHHEGGASFDTVAGIAAVRARNAATLIARWPGYEVETRQYLRRSPLRAPLERARASVARAVDPARMRVLVVGNRFTALGGIEEHARMLVNHLRERHAFTLLDVATQPNLWNDAGSVQVSRTVRHVRYRAENLPPSAFLFGGPASLSSEPVDDFFAQLLEGGGIDLVHIQSLVSWGSLRFAGIAKALGIPVVLSLHDFFVLCPDYNQLLHSRAPCGRARATAGDKDCPECIYTRQFPGMPQMAPGTVGPYLTSRNQAVERLLEASDAIVVPSRFLAERILRAYPEVRPRVEVIAHGIDAGNRAAPSANLARLRVSYLGGLGERKGARVLFAAAQRLAGQPIDFEVLGHCDPLIEGAARASGVKLRGPYAARDIPEKLAGVDLVVIPTLMEETYSLVLSEAQAAGVPVAISALGAIPERVVDGKTGFLLPAGNVEALVALLSGLVNDRSPLERIRRELATHPVRLAADCAHDYQRLFDRVIAMRSTAPVAGVKHAPRPPAKTPEGPGTAAYARFRGLESAQLAALAPAEASLATDWIVSLAPGTTLHPAFHKALAAALASHPQAKFAYADEDRITSRGERYAPVFKTAWDSQAPERWMPGAIVAFRREAALAAGGLRGTGPQANADLARRIMKSSGAEAALHLPCVLGHVLDTPPEAPPAPLLPPAPATAPSITIAIARHAGFEACTRVLEQAREALRGRGIEILVPCTAAEWDRLQRALAARPPGAPVRPVSFDTLAPKGVALNAALIAATTEVVIFVRDDCIPGPTGLDALLMPFADPTVAVVADTALALGFGPDGVAGAPLATGAPQPGCAQPLLQGHARRVSAFDTRCFALRRPSIASVGGFETSAPLSRHLATDLALRLTGAGHGIVAIAQPAVNARGEPMENAAVWEDPVALADEAAWMIRRHGKRLADDPWYPKSLSRARPGLVPETEVVAPPGWHGEGAPRIVAFPFDAWGSGDYRVRAPMAALARANRARVAMMPTHESGRAPNATEMLELAPHGVLAHNFLHDYQLHAARAWKRHMKAPIAFGLDDLLTCIPPWNPYHDTLYRDIVQRLGAALATFDRIVVSTPPIAEALRALRSDVVVIPNAIDLDRWGALRMQPRETGRPRVGWAGAKQHGGDLAWLQPVVEATRAEVDWVFLGDCPAALRPHVAAFHPMVRLDEYPETLAGLELDLAIAPLQDHPFNHAKSNVKLLELGVLGCPVLASDITPYRGAPVARLPNDAAAWTAAIRERTRERQALRAEGAVLRDWVLREYSLSGRLRDWYILLT